MKRVFLLLLACFCLSLSAVFAYNPYAPNQFDTVERNSWEYQAAESLTKAGLTGFSLDRFAPSYQLTRYELTQMVENAIKNRARASASQQKDIDRLQTEFAGDLGYLTTKGEEAQKETPKGVEFDWKNGGSV